MRTVAEWARALAVRCVLWLHRVADYASHHLHHARSGAPCLPLRARLPLRNPRECSLGRIGADDAQ